MKNPLTTLPGVRRLDPAVATAFGCIILLLMVGATVNSSFLSPEYLLQQLQVGSFLALISTGMMLVILLGQIDLSVPWIITVGGMMSTAAAGWGPWGAAFAIPFGILCGVAFGLINGIGVAYLRVPSMIFTLGINAVAQGFMIVRTGGFAPQDMAPDNMHALATGRLVFGIPNALWVWVVVGGLLPSRFTTTRRLLRSLRKRFSMKSATLATSAKPNRGRSVVTLSSVMRARQLSEGPQMGCGSMVLRKTSILG